MWYASCWMRTVAQLLVIVRICVVCLRQWDRMPVVMLQVRWAGTIIGSPGGSTQTSQYKEDGKGKLCAHLPTMACRQRWCQSRHWAPYRETGFVPYSTLSRLCDCMCVYTILDHLVRYAFLVVRRTSLWTRTAWIISSMHSVKCWKQSLVIVVHVDMAASRSCWFVGCPFMLRISHSTTSETCSRLLDWDCMNQLVYGCN